MVDEGYRGRVDRSEGTRERILRAALALVRERPWEEVTTRMVCAAADVTPPTLYHHFGDKSGLATAVADLAFLETFTGRRSLAHSRDPVEVLRFAWGAHVDFGVRNRWLYALMFGWSRPDDSLPGAVSARMVFWQVLERLESAGELSVPVPRAALVFESAVVGMTFQAIRSGLDVEASEHARDAVLASLVRPARRD